MRTFSNERYDDQKPVKPMPFYKPDLQVGYNVTTQVTVLPLFIVSLRKKSFNLCIL